MAEETDSDASSVGLPSLSSIFKDNPPFKIEKGVICYATFKGGYWPAYIKCVYKKQQKATLFYLDSPYVPMSVKFKNIFDFSDYTFSKKTIDILAGHSTLLEKYDKAMSLAQTFLFRRSQGYSDDPLQFFDVSKCYLAFKSIEERLQGEPLSNVSADEPSSNISEVEPSPSTSAKESPSIYSPPPSHSEDSDDDVWKVKEKHIFKDFVQQVDVEKEAAIVAYITAGHADKYLKDIQMGKIPSKTQAFFNKVIEINRCMLYDREAYGCDIVTTPQNLREISRHLLDLYKSTSGKEAQMMDYVNTVWLKESIHHAVARLDAKKKPSVRKGLQRKCKKLY